MTRTRFSDPASRGTTHIPCPQILEQTVRIELTSPAWKAEAQATRPRPLILRAAPPCGARSLVAEARIELACAAYETVLEPLQVLRNKLAGRAGFEPARRLLNRQVPFRLGYRPIFKLVWAGGIEPPTSCSRSTRLPTRLSPEFWSGISDSNRGAPAPKAGGLAATLIPETGSRGTIRTSID